MNTENKIDVTELKPEERTELAMLLYKSGYTVRSDKKKIANNKYSHFVVYRKGA